MFTKMAKKDLLETLEIPNGIIVTKENDFLVVLGQKGVIKRKFGNPKIKLEITGNKITLLSKSASKREKAVLLTYKAHIKNALKGSNESFIYKLKICSGHFPMNVSVSNDVLIIKNFLGEKVPRQVEIKYGVTVKVDGNIITVEGPDKEKVGQVAADIEQTTRRPGFDKRIFQDGIYIIDKAGKIIQ